MRTAQSPTAPGSACCADGKCFQAPDGIVNPKIAARRRKPAARASNVLDDAAFGATRRSRIQERRAGGPKP
jgi:hypothetical protein